MKDEHDKQTRDLLSAEQLRQSTAQRQARLKAKRKAEGWRRKTVWVHEDSRQQGYAAGEKGEACEPEKTPTADCVSWVIGWEAASKQ
jgi:hypothetical protein